MHLVEGAFMALNGTNPEATRACWLCLASSPPYYEGPATSGEITNQQLSQSHVKTSAYTSSLYHRSRVIIGTVPSSHQPLCNQTISISPRNYYLVPPNDTWWAWNTRLTPCVSATVMNLTKDFCVLTQVMPQILYHLEDDLLETLKGRHRQKREPMSLTLAVLLGLGGAAAGIETEHLALYKRTNN